MFRYKTLIGPSLRSRSFDRQKVEAAVAVRCINRFTALEMPEPETPWQITDFRADRSPEAAQTDLQETLARLLAIGAGVLIVAALPA